MAGFIHTRQQVWARRSRYNNGLHGAPQPQWPISLRTRRDQRSPDTDHGVSSEGAWRGGDTRPRDSDRCAELGEGTPCFGSELAGECAGLRSAGHCLFAHVCHVVSQLFLHVIMRHIPTIACWAVGLWFVGRHALAPSEASSKQSVKVVVKQAASATGYPRQLFGAMFGRSRYVGSSGRDALRCTQEIVVLFLRH